MDHLGVQFGEPAPTTRLDPGPGRGKPLDESPRHARRSDGERDPKPETVAAAEQAKRVVRRTTWRYRRNLAMLTPFALMLGLHAAAKGLDGFEVEVRWLFVHEVLRWQGPSSWWLKVALIVLGVGLVLGVLAMRSVAIPGIALTAAALWLLAAGTLGASELLLLLMWLVGTLLSLRYLRAHWRRPRPEPFPIEQPPVEPEPDPEPGEASVQQWWADEVVPLYSGFATTRLGRAVDVPGGFSAPIIGTPGRTLPSHLFGTTPREVIASLKGIGVEQVQIEPTRPVDASRAVLTVVENDASLARRRTLEDDGARIDPRTGRARVGYFFDSRPAHVQFWTRSGGMQMHLTFGRVESGKTRFAETKVALALRCAQLVTGVLDPQEGQCMPDLLKAVTLQATGVPGCAAQLRRLAYVFRRRSAYLGQAIWMDERGRERRGKAQLVPGEQLIDPVTGRTFHMPGFYGVLDELPLLLGDDTYGREAVELLTTSAMTIRKAGGGLDGISQNAGLDYLHEMGLRSNLAGQVAGFRTKASDDHHMVGLAADPSTLEEAFVSTGEPTSGLCYLSGPDARPRAKARTLIVDDPFGWAQRRAAGMWDEVTLGFFADYDELLARGRQPGLTLVAGDAQASPAGGDVQAAIEAVLGAAPGWMELDQVIAAIGGRIAACTLGDIDAAVEALVVEERVWRRGSALMAVSRAGGA
ncbi:hypothetical protein ACIBKY_51520 [Nonomuraea sp. NPDC050394]|uniref:hypothetical protein n=1 Tax=Nonomuraea sp. NPDC050394 TaxID=3364363 RepID=UPI0037B5B97E